eukprot:6175205-Pleurochrysis_carterae.AAC.2
MAARAWCALLRALQPCGVAEGARRAQARQRAAWRTEAACRAGLRRRGSTYWAESATGARAGAERAALQLLRSGAQIAGYARKGQILLHRLHLQCPKGAQMTMERFGERHSAEHLASTSCIGGSVCGVNELARRRTDGTAKGHRQLEDELRDERVVEFPAARLHCRQRLAVFRRDWGVAFVGHVGAVEEVVGTASGSGCAVVWARQSINTALALRQPVADGSGEDVRGDAGEHLRSCTARRRAATHEGAGTEGDIASRDTKPSASLRAALNL